MLETGTAAPDFTLPDQDGEDVTLSSLRGRPVVLYFYPKADTPGVAVRVGTARQQRRLGVGPTARAPASVRSLAAPVRPIRS